MTTLTREQVRNLTPEQQEAVGSAEAQRVRARQELLHRARGKSSKSIAAGLSMGIAFGLVIFSIAHPLAMPFAVIAVGVSAGSLFFAANRRIDALMQLLEDDLKKEFPEDKGKENCAD